MKLSIVIVNYNVKHFLEQCLFSVLRASQHLDCEIFVVDNNSVDGSCGMIKEKFPQVQLIENKDNRGFSKANNQAIRIAKGEYILLLNPDTVVEEDTFLKTVSFMDENEKCGGLGVKMIDGKGKFLPESKRSLPTPEVSFYKIFGLSSLFPKSKKFGRYHLGHLDPSKTHEIEVLAGAFMLLRKSVLDEIGLLDESFFMYGEDIDLSYRITLAGYKNYYFPDTTIIHYKGESTKKGSINYVMVFYNAMIIFAKKHFSKKHARAFSFLINSAVYLRAILALIISFIKNFFLPIADAAIIFTGYYLIKPYWEHYKFPDGGSYPKEFLLYAVPGYILIWIISMFFSGAYEKPIKIAKHIKGILIGSGIILIIYALLSEEMRFSRALILIGTGWTIISTLIFRTILHISNIGDFKLNIGQKKKIIIVGDHKEANRIHSILKKSNINFDLGGLVSPEENQNDQNFIGNINQLKEIVRIHKINEIVFCAKNISSQKIIKTMLQFSYDEVYYKIASPDSISIIGSNSMNTAGDLYVVHINSIANETNKRNKRVIDIFIAFNFIVLFPILAFFVKKPIRFLLNSLSVLIGKKSWVGYHLYPEQDTTKLPKIKKGILSPLEGTDKRINAEIAERINMLYAKDYKLLNDILIIFRNLSNLGEKHYKL